MIATAPAPQRPNLRASVGQLIDIADVKWWAMALLDGLTQDEKRVRRALQRGRKPNIIYGTADRWWAAYATLSAKANALAERRSLQQWIDQAYNECDHSNIHHGGGPTTRSVRDAALSGVRSFAQFIGLADDDDMPMVFEDFHVQTVNVMRQSERPAMALLPFQFGKTVLSSEVVPLMDWCEWAQSTQGRVYHADNHVTKWTGRLMQHVEHNDAMHRIFPWVAKPIKGDVAFGIWSSEGFAIRGRNKRDKSFEALTIGAGKTGLRYHRMGVDDVVVSKEANSVPIQDRNFQYLTTGVFTTKQRTIRVSPYGTVFPGLYQIGTLFEMNDVNYRMNEHFEEKGWKTIRFDIFPQGRKAAKERNITLWPRVMPYTACAEVEQEIGPDAFEKRCRNRVRSGGHVAFPIEHLRRAESEMWEWGVVPVNTRAMIGFDPGSGKITRYSKNPAVVVYGEQDLSLVNELRVVDGLTDSKDTSGDAAAMEELDYWQNTLVHIVEAHRLRGYTFPRQCEFLADLATRLGIPVAVEDNHIQGAYGEEINRRFPWVKTICHTTSDNKRDPVQGVETFAPLFARDRIVIHARGAPPDNIAALRTEFAQWTGRDSRHTTDLVMAAWIAKFQTFHERDAKRGPTFRRMQLPSYARGGFSGYRRFRLVGHG